MGVAAPNLPRSMRRPEVREQRLAALDQPHIAPLTDLVRRFRSRDGSEYPYFDPADGGANASLLFLFEKPGPMTVEKGTPTRTGSGFISRDNDDPTAEATFEFMRQARVPRRETVLWNTIPGWNGTRRIVTDELRAGIRDLAELLSLLPNVRTVVLVGQKAAKAELRILELGSFCIFKSAHPSPLVRASYPDQWRNIPAVWLEAAKHAGVWQPEG